MLNIRIVINLSLIESVAKVKCTSQTANTIGFGARGLRIQSREAVNLHGKNNYIFIFLSSNEDLAFACITNIDEKLPRYYQNCDFITDRTQRYFHITFQVLQISQNIYVHHYFETAVFVRLMATLVSQCVNAETHIWPHHICFFKFLIAVFQCN